VQYHYTALTMAGRPAAWAGGGQRAPQWTPLP